MRYYEGADYWVKKVDFPNMASESVVVSNGDGTFTIFINTLFSEERQADRLAHELKHLEEEHFYRDDMEIRDVERQADGIFQPEREIPPETPRLINVFTEFPKGKIALFNSLDSFGHYISELRIQYDLQHKKRKEQIE